MIDVTRDDGQVRLTLRDNGVGLPPEGAVRAGHYGLRWLAERVESLNGVLTVDAAQPHGVRLKVSIPLPVEPTLALSMPPVQARP